MKFTLDCFGENNLKLFGLSNKERIERMAKADGGKLSGGLIRANLDYAFDPLWFRHISSQQGQLLTDNGALVLGHVSAEQADALREGRLPDGCKVWDLADDPVLYNHSLRKKQKPFCLKLTPANKPIIERESYFGAYKGVTDVLTKYLWPVLAFHLTRLAAALKMSPNMVTSIGAFMCVLATYLFWQGDYGQGIAAGFVFMVLDTVDGKLARCTMTSSYWGNIFDHGIDLVHPPFWYFAWAVGLASWEQAFDSATFWWIQGLLLAGYVAQRLVEGAFIAKFGIHVHVWRKFDSDFRLITARRNPNIVLLMGGLLFGRPDIGLWLVLGWTIISLLVHLLQLAQAALAPKGSVTSWLEAQA